mgnify:CR=1 FL=1
MNTYQKRKERKEKRENNSEAKVVLSTGINKWGVMKKHT